MTDRARKGLTRTFLNTGAAVAALTLAGAAHAQEAASAPPVPAESPAAATSDNDAETVVVIGTRRTDRTLTNSASPVDVIGQTELVSQPAANMLDALKTIIPSFFVGQNTISDASSFVRSPSLRGLPGDEVLVMLDGKRFNRSALVQVYTGGDTGLSFGSQGSDISSIPSIAVKNLQVLRDGATAQYGSDAIAGVLNYGLRDNKTGLELDGRYGQYYEGDGRSKMIAGNLGLALGSIGFVNISAEYDHDGQTSRGETRPLAYLFAQQNPTLADQIPNYPGPAQIWGSSPTHGYKLLVNSGLDVTSSSQLYLFANVAHVYGNESFNYRSPISGTFTDEAGASHTLGRNGAFSPIFYQTQCPAGSATCAAGGYVADGNTFQFTQLYPAGFTPRFVGKTNQAYGTLGYKGDFAGGLHYDLSGTISRNSLGLSMYDSLNASYGPQSQTSFQFGKLIQKEQDANLDLSYPLEVGLASPLTISAGAEYRHESYTQTAGDEQSYGVGPYSVAHPLYVQTAPGVYQQIGTTATASPGASGYGGTSPESAGTSGQRSYGVYGDLEVDPIKGLSVGVAGRYEHYSTFGGRAVGKINAIYEITKGLSIRGTVGTGFHAPSPGQSADEILTTNFVGGNQVQTGTYPVNNPIAQYYGASTLKPEKSTNFGAGFVATPMSNLTLTVDGYSIKVNDRIGISQNFTVTDADIAAQPALLAVGAGGNINYFTNGFNTRTSGVDVVGTYHTRLVGGGLNLTLAYNYNKSKVTAFDPAVISEAQIIDVKHLAPNNRGNLTGTWTMGGFTVNARENYYSWWRDEVDYPGQKFASRFTTDLDVSYTFNETVTFTVGGANLFDTHPEKIEQSSANPIYPITGSTADGQVYPRNGGPFGFNGGFWYARVRVKF